MYQDKGYNISSTDPYNISYPLTLQTKTDTCANSEDPAETSQKERSNQNIHCGLFCFYLLLKRIPFPTVGASHSKKAVPLRKFGLNEVTKTSEMKKEIEHL